MNEPEREIQPESVHLDGVQFVDEAATINEETYLALDALKSTNAVHVGAEDKSSLDYKTDKFKALYQCRAILSKHGTMQERSVCERQLKRMRKLGIKSV